MAVDRRNIAASSGTTGTATRATLMNSNPDRSGFSIQNQGTGPLFVYLGTGGSTTTYHLILQGGTVQGDGKGGVYSQTGGSVYTGAVSIAAGATVPTFYTYVEY